MASILTGASSGQSAVPDVHVDGVIEYSLVDFHGRYHLNRIKNKNTIPGYSLARDRELENATKARQSALDESVASIGRRLAERTKTRDRRVAAEVKAHMEGTVGTAARGFRSFLRRKEIELQEHEAHKGQPRGRSYYRTMVVREFFNFVKGDKAQMVDRVVKRGFRSVDIQEESHGYTALLIAAKKGFLETLEVLLRHGADPQIPSHFGKFPLQCCWDWWADDADASVRQLEGRRTCKLLRLLLRYGAEPNVQDAQGNTALHFAAALGPPAAVKALLEFQASEHVANVAKRTPIDVATASQNREHLRLLNNWSRIRGYYKTEEFYNAWAEFCREEDSSLMVSKSAKVLAGELLVKEQRAMHSREAQQHVLAADDLVTGGQETANERLISRKLLRSTGSLSSLLQLKSSKRRNKRDRKAPTTAEELLQPTIKAKRLPRTKALMIPLDQYICGRASAPFVETKSPNKHQATSKQIRRDSPPNHVAIELQKPISSKDLLMEERPMTHNDARRLLSAVEIARDGSIQVCVRREAMSSSMLTSRRHVISRRASLKRNLCGKDGEGEYRGTEISVAQAGPPGAMEGDEYKKSLFRATSLTVRAMMELASPVQGESGGHSDFHPVGKSPRANSASGRRLDMDGEDIGGKTEGISGERSKSQFNNETDLPPEKMVDRNAESMAQALEEIKQKHANKMKLRNKWRRRDLALQNMRRSEKEHKDAASTSDVEGELLDMDIRFHASAPFVREKALNVRPKKETYIIGGPLEKPWANVTDSYKVKEGRTKVTEESNDALTEVGATYQVVVET